MALVKSENRQALASIPNALAWVHKSELQEAGKLGAQSTRGGGEQSVEGCWCVAPLVSGGRSWKEELDMEQQKLEPASTSDLSPPSSCYNNLQRVMAATSLFFPHLTQISPQTTSTIQPSQGFWETQLQLTGLYNFAPPLSILELWHLYFTFLIVFFFSE